MVGFSGAILGDWGQGGGWPEFLKGGGGGWGGSGF